MTTNTAARTALDETRIRRELVECAIDGALCIRIVEIKRSVVDRVAHILVERVVDVCLTAIDTVNAPKKEYRLQIGRQRLLRHACIVAFTHATRIVLFRRIRRTAKIL